MASLKDLLRITQRRTDEVVKLTVTGEVDIVTGPLFEEGMKQSLRQHPTRVILDLSGVTFFSSHGVDLLDSAAASAAELGIEVELRASNCVERVVVLVGPESLLEICSRSPLGKQLCVPDLLTAAGIRT